MSELLNNRAAIARQIVEDLSAKKHREAQLKRKRLILSSSRLTHELLKSLLNYDQETGIFTWKVKTANCISIGDRAGYDDKKYIRISLMYRLYSAHRLAWFYVYGEWPKNVIDHRNGNRYDNRIENLRDVSTEMNNQNITGRVRSRMGFRGVLKTKDSKRFRASISIKGQTISLGTYDSPEQAHAVYLKAKTELHEGFVNE